MKFELKQTCYACPEQYDVFLDGEQVGYLRLRHGIFRCYYPNCNGEIIFVAYLKGDKGIFDDKERELYIGQAIAEIEKKLLTKYEVK